MNSPIDPAIVMPDVQSSADTRHIPIQRVGIRGVRHPMLVESADGSPQGLSLIHICIRRAPGWRATTS